MNRTFLIVVLGCGSSSSTNEAPVQPQPTVPQRVLPSDSPRAPRKPTPAGDRVEVLVTNTESATDLVVTDEYLYWIGGGQFEKQNILRAPHQRDTSPSLLFDAPEGAHELVLVGDRLVWSQAAWSIFTMPLTGGTPTELVKLEDAPSQMLDRDGLVVAAYMPGETGDARVFRVSKRGEITEIAKLLGSESPHIAFDPKGDLYVATDDAGGWHRSRTVVFGRVVEGRVVPIVKQPGGVHLIAADADSIYYVSEDNLVNTIYRLPSGAKKPLRLARDHENGSITALAVDEQYVYWAEYMTGTADGKLWRLPKTGGGKPQAIADCGETTRLVFYGPDLYWADARLNRIARIRR